MTGLTAIRLKYFFNPFMPSEVFYYNFRPVHFQVKRCLIISFTNTVLNRNSCTECKQCRPLSEVILQHLILVYTVCKGLTFGHKWFKLRRIFKDKKHFPSRSQWLSEPKIKFTT